MTSFKSIFLIVFNLGNWGKEGFHNAPLEERDKTEQEPYLSGVLEKGPRLKNHVVRKRGWDRSRPYPTPASRDLGGRVMYGPRGTRERAEPLPSVLMPEELFFVKFEWKEALYISCSLSGGSFSRDYQIRLVIMCFIVSFLSNFIFIYLFVENSFYQLTKQKTYFNSEK